MAPAPIGGFFERHQANGPATDESLLAAWTAGRPCAAFVNARSAFAALVARSPAATVWLPAFLCRDLIQPAFAARAQFYPVLEDFEPDLSGVVAQAKAGDLVLVVAYFGLPLGQGVCATLAQRPDLQVVEDRAQAISGAAASVSAWTLFSPRKLLGVADGGLLIARDAASAPPQPSATADPEALWAAAKLRAADPAGARNAEWHAANQAKEAAMTASPEAMTDESRAILAAAPLSDLAARRLENWRTLDASLRRWSALPADPAAPPLGYVLRLEPGTRDRLRSALNAERIFAAVHWPAIAAPAADFPREAQWTRELLTLPCDHRYGSPEMARIADCVTACLA